MSEKQTPQPIEKTENAMEIMEPKEAWIRLHTQEVRGSSPCAPTIVINKLRTFGAKTAHPFAHPDRVAQ